jgi:hypothetical protein
MTIHEKDDNCDTEEKDDEVEMPELNPYFEWCHRHSK